MSPGQLISRFALTGYLTGPANNLRFNLLPFEITPLCGKEREYCSRFHSSGGIFSSEAAFQDSLRTPDPLPGERSMSKETGRATISASCDDFFWYTSEPHPHY
jgi:hypothetical protein